MKSKTIIKMVLLSFVALSLGWLVTNQGQAPEARDEPNTSLATESSTSDAVAEPVSGNTSKTPLPNRIIVYYFHTTFRCPTCHKIENYTREAIKSGFAKELREGRLEFLALNVDESANAHFIEDFKLHTKSVVVVDIKKGKQVRWKNLEKVWEYVGNKPLFLQYVQDEVSFYLKGK